MSKKIFFVLALILFIFFSSREFMNYEEFSSVSNLMVSGMESLEPEYAYIESVIDGDTVKVFVDDKLQTVRLIGIDTPESVHPLKQVECFALEASDFTKQYLESKNVLLFADETQGDIDKFGRKLRYVYLEDGTNFNEFIVRSGFAYEYTYNLPYKYQNDFIESEKFARDNLLGLWAEGVCVN